ncbi:MAG: PA2779 family protein [Candidatus Omnitrophica bacterium]|nr:PA2779 family protein [Candidatus Omnitrophota bacterium]
MFLESLLNQKGILKLMLAIALICGVSPANSVAMPIDSQVIVQSSAGQSLYLEKVQSFLNKDIVQKRLSKIGLNKEDAQLYVSQLDAVQLERLANKVDTIESAGNTGVVILLVLLLIAMCVLYFADYGLKLEPRRKNKK